MASKPPHDLRPIVVSGPSGVGKGTLIQKLVDSHPAVFATVVSHTTRQPRSGEVEGVNYHYISADEFSSMIEQDAFVQYAIFGGHYYGTSKQTIADQKAKGKVIILNIEMQGVKQMRETASIDARYVFVKPPSLEELERRIRARGTEKEEAIQRMLARAWLEIQSAESPGVNDVVVVNDDLGKAYAELEGFVYGR